MISIQQKSSSKMIFLKLNNAVKEGDDGDVCSKSR